MSAPPKSPGAPITDRRELVEYLEQGNKPADAWRIGTEHEKFAFRLGDNRPLPYEGEQGIGRILSEMATRYDWAPVKEGENIIALTKGQASITLEPGGQFELSGAPLSTIHQTCGEVSEHLAQVRAIGADLGIGMIGLGFNPKWKREDIPWMPKGRYRIMRDYMPKKGTMGLDMMTRTSTVQVNLDFSSEADMVKKFRVSLALQPIATALFANSPFKEGKPNGFQSLRSHVWTDTDPDRCGDLPFVFEDGFGFERYADHALGVPMYFVYRDGQYIDASGQDFRAFLRGELPALPGERPLITDWVDHLTTLFPEVRLKRFLEMRGADGGPWARLCALPALWVGLLYDTTALDAAWDMIKDWTEEERAQLRNNVPRLGLDTPFRKGTVLDLARQTVAISRNGLDNRARLAGMGDNESHFLDALQAIVDSGVSPATELLNKFNGEWGGDIDRVYAEYAY
ncbi:glutamate--cysteine ligase [Nitrospirillum viridazoti]|uniref:Glutamate--cysteine ligase n=1 Tax=Nitrospirillum viridazoti CBAmc TaxID=1441467 RepID=A0A248JRU9_9PROT|nr:glutamate--cysteine ligase [Nitrospirillum amazonense]ASG21240.1 glutamate--cysteine ligase [Nitrospirillum amazonense CBAmc]TWB32237.1 glutamate--cysteine ligase [Nitrospirillum amazonense]